MIGWIFKKRIVVEVKEMEGDVWWILGERKGGGGCGRI